MFNNNEIVKMDLEDFMKNGLKNETGYVVVLGYDKHGSPIINTEYLPPTFLRDPIGRFCVREIFRGVSFVDAFEGYYMKVLLRETHEVSN